ncbi:MAG: MgtC/SapB family protein [Deltaproteobacteria bacterium]|nr:MgtC/SapB family protein [Deltaproteobacteria bacterium]
MEGFIWIPELRFALALGLGFLVGMERERSRLGKKQHAHLGVRTYSVISLFGFGCAWLHTVGASWAIPAGLVAVAALVIFEYSVKAREGLTGLTSETAGLLTFAIGALTVVVDPWVPITLGVVATILLSEKAEIERFIERLEQRELTAILRFLLVSAIIYPALPNQPFTRFAVNPASVWKIVILVSSVGFAGYLLTKRYGARMGLWLSGVLGGVVSSTAVAVAMGRLAAQSPARSRNALAASLLAGSVMYPRIFVLVVAINPAFARPLAWRMAWLCAVGIVLAITVRPPRDDERNPDVSSLSNPFEIKPAMAFAALFVVLTVITRVVSERFGGAGVAILAAVVGVADVDPFLLSLAGQASPVGAPVVTAMLIAMASNTVAKGAYFAWLGAPARRDAIWRYAVWAMAHVPVIAFSG